MNKIFNSMMAMAIAAFTFTACEDVPEPYNNPYDQIKPTEPEEVIEPAGSGTVEDPYNIARALEVCQEVGESGTSEKVYAKGIIVGITEIDTGSYGNATFLIADNNSSSTLTVYRAYSLGGEKFTKSDEIAEGDTVVIYGNLVNYKSNTPEFTQGCYIYSIKKGEGSGEAPATPGTAEAPLTVAEALAYTNALAADKQSAVGFVKGKICAIKEVDTGSYGNATYSISDDGTEDNALQVYRGYSLGGEKFKSADEIKVGDEVIITGKLVNYKGNTPQFAQGSSIYKLNGGNGGNTGNNDNNNGTPKGNGTQTSPFNVAGIINATANLESGAFYNDGAEVYVSGIVTETKEISTQYGNATYYISDDESGSNKFYVFRGKLLDGANVSAATDLQVGDVVTVCGKIKNYNGTIEFDQGNYLTALTKGNGGNNNDNGNGGEVTDNGITVVYGDLGLSDLSSPIILTDGTTLTFSQEDGKNPPIYHASTSIIRMYAHNSVTINAGSKKIASVVFAYDTYQGTAHKGNDQMYGQAGSNKITPTKDDKNVTFSNVNSSTLKVVNDFEANSGGTQFRCTGVTISYAK